MWSIFVYFTPKHKQNIHLVYFKWSLMNTWTQTLYLNTKIIIYYHSWGNTNVDMFWLVVHSLKIPVERNKKWSWKVEVNSGLSSHSLYMLGQITQCCMSILNGYCSHNQVFTWGMSFVIKCHVIIATKHRHWKQYINREWHYICVSRVQPIYLKSKVL